MLETLTNVTGIITATRDYIQMPLLLSNTTNTWWGAKVEFLINPLEHDSISRLGTGLGWYLLGRSWTKEFTRPTGAL